MFRKITLVSLIGLVLITSGCKILEQMGILPEQREAPSEKELILEEDIVEVEDPSYKTIKIVEISEEDKIQNAMDKRERVRVGMSDLELMQLYPIPDDKEKLNEDCQAKEDAIAKMHCLHTVADKYFEGGFSAEGVQFCQQISKFGGSQGNIDRTELCLCQKIRDPAAQAICQEAVEEESSSN